jgi:hypothetical protein
MSDRYGHLDATGLIAEFRRLASIGDGHPGTPLERPARIKGYPKEAKVK